MFVAPRECMGQSGKSGSGDARLARVHPFGLTVCNK